LNIDTETKKSCFNQSKAILSVQYTSFNLKPVNTPTNYRKLTQKNSKVKARGSYNQEGKNTIIPIAEGTIYQENPVKEEKIQYQNHFLNGRKEITTKNRIVMGNQEKSKFTTVVHAASIATFKAV
jgi:hypothetical protein